LKLQKQKSAQAYIHHLLLSHSSIAANSGFVGVIMLTSPAHPTKNSIEFDFIIESKSSCRFWQLSFWVQILFPITWIYKSSFFLNHLQQKKHNYTWNFFWRIFMIISISVPQGWGETKNILKKFLYCKIWYHTYYSMTQKDCDYNSALNLKIPKASRCQTM
jgi:hypothetical protein